MKSNRDLVGWALYDWANSAYVTTVAVAVFPLYFGGVIVPAGGVDVLGIHLSPTALLGFMGSAVSLLLFLCAPVLGAIADISGSKKKFLMTACFGGSLASVLLGVCGPGDVGLAATLFMISELGFVGGNIFYDAFLPQVAPENRLDRVSGIGYAAGYIGGGLQFALALVLVGFHDRFGITEGAAARLSMVMAGIWWAGFGAVSFFLLKERPPAGQSGGNAVHDTTTVSPGMVAITRLGIARLAGTLKRVTKFRHLLLFLAAFMIYNDAIQTVIKMASIYGQQELGLSSASIMGTLLVIQFVAFGGALLFGRLAELFSTKLALALSLLLWTGVTVFGFLMRTAGEFLILGIAVGLVMGGSQALSRSLYATMIPPDAAAEFYSFYSVFTKFSAIWGTAVFAIIDMVTGSSRQAVLALSLFFLIGLGLLSLVDVDKARQARLTDLS